MGTVPQEVAEAGQEVPLTAHAEAVARNCITQFWRIALHNGCLFDRKGQPAFHCRRSRMACLEAKASVLRMPAPASCSSTRLCGTSDSRVESLTVRRVQLVRRKRKLVITSRVLPQGALESNPNNRNFGKDAVERRRDWTRSVGEALALIRKQRDRSRERDVAATTEQPE